MTVVPLPERVPKGTDPAETAAALPDQAISILGLEDAFLELTRSRTKAPCEEDGA